MAKDVGLTARLRFIGDAAIAGMRSASVQFGKLSFNAERFKSGMRDVNQGLTGLSIAGAAAGAGAAFSVKKFADFDDGMAAVKAVLGEAQREHFPALTAQAQKLGATTSFTATQAANAMENLARAGLKPKEIMASISPVLAAAAAEGMDLATAADIVASNLKGFSLDASQATRVADALAFVSAKTNTNMAGLQEGLKFVAPVAKQMGFTIEETAASLGVLADIGLKGSLAGTGLKNALLKIAKSAKSGMVPIGKFRAEVQDASGNMLPLNVLMTNIAQTLGRIKDPAKRAQASMKLLGLRGMGAAAAFDALGSGKNSAEKVGELFNDMQKNAGGAAAEMQRMRLDSLKGDFTLLSSAVDGVVNSFGAALAPAVRGMMGQGGMGGLTGTLSQAAKAFQFFAANTKALLSDTPVEIEGVSRGTMDFVKQLLLGMRDVKEMLGGVFGAIQSVAGAFGFTTGAGSGMVRLTTKLLGVAAAVAPIALALKGATKLFGGFARTGLGVAKMLTSFLPGKLGGAAGKMAGAAANAAAQPVRVVNFNEMPGAGPLGGAAPGAGGPAQLGLFARLRAGLTGVASKVPFVGGKLTMSMTALKAGLGKAGLLGKIAGGGGLIAAVGAAGAAGYALGTVFDRTFGISNKLASGLHAVLGASERLASAKRVEAHANQTAVMNAQKMANQLALLSSQKGVKELTVEGGKRVALTRATAEARIGSFLTKQGFNQGQIADTLKSMESTLRGIKVEVKVDGQKIASATAKAGQQAKERGARRTSTGARRRASLGAVPAPAN